MQGKDKSLKKTMWDMVGDAEEVRRDNKRLKILAMKSQPKNKKKEKNELAKKLKCDCSWLCKIMKLHDYRERHMGGNTSLFLSKI